MTNGWLGFIAFAIPNAVGLGLFGWILGSPRIDPAKVLSSVEGPYAGLFLACQFFAVAITIFGFAAYAWMPLFGTNAALGIFVVILVACSIGHAISIRGLKKLHIAYLVLGLVASLTALYGLWNASDAPPTPLAAFDERFYGLAIPTLVGFLLGPWMDIQQWQRAVEIRRSGGSVRVAYASGAALFFGLLVVNALLAGAAGPAGTVTAADGVPGAQPAVALAIARNHLDGPGLAFVIWTVIAAVSTIDSFYCATRWMMTSITTRSTSPLMAFVPAGLVASPVWIVLAALVTAAAMIRLNLSLIYLMVPFATLLVGAAACLVCETLGAPRRYDPVLCAMIGLTACLIFLAGHVAPVPAFLAVAPLIGLIGALPMILALFGWQKEETREIAPVAEASVPKVAVVTVTREEVGTSHGFDGQWFVLRMIPTYDDTNSVGNVYFANYVRWVGKAREMFFNICMPKFDLKTTDFYVLTKSFTHDFRREAVEFEPITVKIKIANHNRKFVTLAHEIHSDLHGLLGRGEQSLMFVDTVHYRPLDIPRSIVEGFLPYWPKTSPHAVGTAETAAIARA
ncbi:hypothetical protein AwMethylo_42200 [Methylobacterium sp.]|nr:hypothetical protein AwMethylo_42200 [Methylobacterium sp.]